MTLKRCIDLDIFVCVDVIVDIKIGTPPIH